jgi:uncharacterized tellurite resistance protein B-like protein
MEGIISFIIIIVIINVVWNFLVNLFSGRDTPGGGSPSEKFKIRVKNDVVKGDDFNWDIFNIEMKGEVTGPYDNFNAKVIMQIFDVTNGSEEIILTTLEDFQKDNSEIFWYESKSFSFRYQYSLFTDWVQAVKVPKMFLVAPRKGLRKFKFKVYIVNAINDQILAEASTKVSYANPDSGYKDASDNRKYFEEMMIKTALLVSASDGHMDEEEAAVIKKWVKKRISGYTEEYQDEQKQRLNGYIKEAYEEIQNGYIDIYDVLDGIENIASEGDKYELFQLCLDVAQADGEADTKELKIVNDIADYINLDEKQFMSMIEKSLPIHMHTGDQTPEQIIGIKSEMSKDEIKKHLGRAFKKWNAVVAHKDPDKRKQAEEMLNLITNLRKKYL